MKVAQLSMWVAGAFLLLPAARAQDRLKLVPAYERYQKISKEVGDAIKWGTVSVTWKDGGKAFEYSRDGKRYQFDVENRPPTELAPAQGKGTNSAASGVPQRSERRRRPPSPGRAKQFASMT